MIEETGRVVEVNEEAVWVETIKQSACSTCSAQKGCGQSLLAKVGDGKRLRMRVDNPAYLAVDLDDQVVLGVGERSFLTASLVVYLVPLIVMFLFALIAQQQALAEPMVILFAAVGLCTGFMCSRYLSKIMGRSCNYKPVLLRVI
ncbi:MAG: SoxR reducing system RseC family protein [Amphritea sp.]